MIGVSRRERGSISESVINSSNLENSGVRNMAKRSRKKSVGNTPENELPIKKGPGKLLEEIIQESHKPDCNLILLDGKIREMEKSGENCLPLLMKRLRQGKSSEQKVILDLLIRKKSDEVIKNIKKIINENDFPVNILRQALLQLQKWEEPVDENLLKLLEEGEDIIYAIQKFTELDGFLEEGTEDAILKKFAPLPGQLKFSIIKQVIDGFPKALPFILRLIKEESDLDEKTINLLASNATAEVGKIFSNMVKNTKDKNLRQLLKRHLFQMKSRGLEVVIPETDESEPLKIVNLEPSQATVYISGIDYVGDRLIFLSKSVLRWGVLFFQITLSDQDGIKNFSAFDLKRKEIKNFLKKISEDGVVQFIEITPDYGYFLIDEAYQINLQKGIPLPEQFNHWKVEIDDLRGSVTEPIIYSCIPHDTIHEATLIAARDQYHSLFELEEFKSWFLEPRLVWGYLEKLRVIDDSPLILDPHHVEQRQEAIFSEAVQKIFDENFRRIYQRRLEETAYMLFRTNKEEEAKCALCAAWDLKPQRIASEKHVFLQKLVHRSILFYAEGTERRRDKSLIVPR
jgi:hypothetical protein